MASLLLDVAYLVWEILLAFAEAVFRIFVPVPLKDVDGKVVVITGAGHGIGRELALQMAALGARIVAWDLNMETCRETCAEIEAKHGENAAFPVQCDVSVEKEVRRAAEETRNNMGRVDILFNNAGIMPARPLTQVTADEVEKVFRVNVFSQFHALRTFLPEFYAADAGHVVAMSSIAGIVGTAYLSAYCSSKFAVKGMMDALAYEQRRERPGSKVKLTTVHPFTINTGLAVDPKTRFPWLIPITEPGECARVMIEAMRRDEEEVFVPRFLRMSFRVGACLPRRVQFAMGDFLECVVGY